MPLLCGAGLQDLLLEQVMCSRVTRTRVPDPSGGKEAASGTETGR